MIMTRESKNVITPAFEPPAVPFFLAEYWVSTKPIKPGFIKLFEFGVWLGIIKDRLFSGSPLSKQLSVVMSVH